MAENVSRTLISYIDVDMFFFMLSAVFEIFKNGEVSQKSSFYFSFIAAKYFLKTSFTCMKIEVNKAEINKHYSYLEIIFGFIQIPKIHFSCFNRGNGGRKCFS